MSVLTLLFVGMEALLLCDRIAQGAVLRQLPLPAATIRVQCCATPLQGVVESCYNKGIHLASTEEPIADNTVATASPCIVARTSEAAGALYRFSRPHTIWGTLLACFSGVGRVVFENPVVHG